MELEEHLANAIEDPAKAAIEKVRERVILNDEDRMALAKYTVALWKRVPVSDPTLAPLVETKRSEIADVIARYKRDLPPDIWHRDLLNNSSPRVVETLLTMRWRFVYTNDAYFLTSDNPVFFFKHEGVGRLTSELTFPISSGVALSATHRRRDGNEYLPATSAVVSELNRRTASNATRFVHSSRNDLWVLPFVCKEQWRLNRLV